MGGGLRALYLTVVIYDFSRESSLKSFKQYICVLNTLAYLMKKFYNPIIDII